MGGEEGRRERDVISQKGSQEAVKLLQVILPRSS
jgi:hypothetical protein